MEPIYQKFNKIDGRKFYHAIYQKKKLKIQNKNSVFAFPV